MLLYPEGLPVGVLGFKDVLVGCLRDSGASSKNVLLGYLVDLGSQLMIQRGLPLLPHAMLKGIDQADFFLHLGGRRLRSKSDSLNHILILIFLI